MTTWPTLLADVRSDLQDTGATPRWSDGLLYLYAKDAILDYSRWFPKRVDRVEIVPTDEHYALPADFVEDIFVEMPKDRFLERRMERPGLKYNKTSRPFLYYIEGGSMYTNTPSPESIFLTYYASHPVPTSEKDTTFVLTVPDKDMELIRLYIKAKAYEQTRGRQANLDRFKNKGARDDNPVQPEVYDLMNEYNAKVSERIPGGTVQLFRSGRSR